MRRPSCPLGLTLTSSAQCSRQLLEYHSSLCFILLCYNVHSLPIELSTHLALYACTVESIVVSRPFCNPIPDGKSLVTLPIWHIFIVYIHTSNCFPILCCETYFQALLTMFWLLFNKLSQSSRFIFVQH